MYIYIYIYIERERERERDAYCKDDCADFYIIVDINSQRACKDD